MYLITLSPRPVMAFEEVTIDATAGGIALTPAKYRTGAGALTQMAKEAFVTVEANTIRWQIDPAVTVLQASAGHEAAAGAIIYLQGQQIVNFRAIRTGGSSGTIRVTYFA